MRENLGCTLTTIPGVNVITAVKILAEIGDIKRFSNANKLAQFAGIAPLHLSSSGKGKDVATKQGNRRLQVTIYFLATVARRGIFKDDCNMHTRYEGCS